METLKRHPAEEGFGQQNAHMLNSLEAAQQCVRRLVGDGFTVHTIEMRDRQPVIWIAPDARCANFKGVARTTRTTLGTRFIVMTTTIDGCYVQWIGN